MPPTENHDELLHGPIVTSETAIQTACLARELLAEVADTMALWTKELESTDCIKVDEHEINLIDNEILDSKVRQKFPRLVQPPTT